MKKSARIIATVLVLGFSVGFSACSTWITRTDYNLTHYDGIVVTDSPSERQPDKIRSGEIQVKQSILLQNVSDKTAFAIEPEDARFLVNGESVPASCARYRGKSGELLLAPGEKTRIDCVVDLDANRKNKFANRDSVGSLEIPYKGAFSPMKFAYYLKLEDFEQ